MRRAVSIGSLGVVLAGVVYAGQVWFPSNPPASRVLPPAPAKLWDVSLIESAEFLRAQYPSLRTSQDGRIGISAKVEDHLRLSLLAPESLSGLFLDGKPGVSVTTRSNTLYFAPTALHRSSLASPAVRHATILDLGGIAPGQQANPYYANGVDNYDLVVVALVVASSATPPTEVWQTRSTSRSRTRRRRAPR